MATPPEKRSKNDLHPWGVVLATLFDLDSDEVVKVITRTGLQVDWGLAPGANYSHATRKRAYLPRIQEAFCKLSEEKQLVVASLVVGELKRGYSATIEPLKLGLEKIGWTLKGERLVPGTMKVQELFFPKGSQHDAYREIRTIVGRAKRTVTIIDPYVDGSLFSLLSAHPAPQLEVQVVSSRLPSDFGLEAKKFLAHYPKFSLEVRTTREFHDRFIILDETECFHLGASIKDAGDKVCMISQVQDLANRDALILQSQQTWAGATKVTI